MFPVTAKSAYHLRQCKEALDHFESSADPPIVEKCICNLLERYYHAPTVITETYGARFERPAIFRPLLVSLRASRKFERHSHGITIYCSASILVSYRPCFSSLLAVGILRCVERLLIWRSIPRSTTVLGRIVAFSEWLRLKKRISGILSMCWKTIVFEMSLLIYMNNHKSCYGSLAGRSPESLRFKLLLFFE